MAMFLGHTAIMLELSVFVAGLVLWHFGRQGAAVLLRTAGLVAMIGAVLGALCTGYYMVRYQVQGDFEYAHPFHGRRHEMMERGMGPGMMGQGMMGQERMGPRAGTEEKGAEPGHEEHHPEQATE